MVSGFVIERCESRTLVGGWRAAGGRSQRQQGQAAVVRPRKLDTLFRETARGKARAEEKAGEKV